MTSELPDDVATHPLAGLVDVLEAAIAGVADVPAWTVAPRDLADLLPRLATVRNQLDALSLRLLGEADRHHVGDLVGAACTAGWWASSTRTTKRDAHRQVALAALLDDDAHRSTAGALAAGAISTDQAAVILQAVDALPGELVPASVRADAETTLVGMAADHDPKDLRVLGRRILEVVAPDVAERHEQQVLENEERHAAATATFVMHPDHHGSMVGRFKIPVLAGEILAKHLAALAAPKHRGPDAVGTDRGTRVARPLRLGQAFVEYVETRAADDTPTAGGIAASVVVTMTLENLLGSRETAALLDTGASITASEARRIACEAGVIPAVLGGRSQPLDVGRRSRFHTGPQRYALMLRDRGCAELHCDWPPAMCHVHHPLPWSKGGGTSVLNGMLLCPRHHTLAHDARFQLKADKHGRVTFSRRT